LVNPHAGAIRKDGSLIDELRACAGPGIELCVTKNADSLNEVARDFARRELAHLAIVGGDGSASLSLTAIEKAYGDAPLPTIALLRGGTMNTVARSLGVSTRSPTALLRAAILAWRTPERVRFHHRPALRVGDRLGFLFGTGIFYGFLDAYYQAGNDQPSPLTALTVFLRGAGSALVAGPAIREMIHETIVEVRSELGVWPARNYVALAAGTVAEVGLGFRPFHRAFSSVSEFHLLGLTGPVGEVAKDLPRVFLGRGFRPTVADEGLTGWAEISAPGGRIDYAVDGDLHRSEGALRLSLGPTFSFLTS
jgi:diacylglycerol kinase family enzyme